MDDKELMQKGWQEMSQALDREMPQSTRKRQRFVFILWWIVGLAIAILGYSAFNAKDKDRKAATDLIAQEGSGMAKPMSSAPISTPRLQQEKQLIASESAVQDLTLGASTSRVTGAFAPAVDGTISPKPTVPTRRESRLKKPGNQAGTSTLGSDGVAAESTIITDLDLQDLQDFQSQQQGVSKRTTSASAISHRKVWSTQTLPLREPYLSKASLEVDWSASYDKTIAEEKSPSWRPYVSGTVFGASSTVLGITAGLSRELSGRGQIAAGAGYINTYFSDGGVVAADGQLATDFSASSMDLIANDLISARRGGIAVEVACLYPLARRWSTGLQARWLRLVHSSSSQLPASNSFRSQTKPYDALQSQLALLPVIRFSPYQGVGIELGGHIPLAETRVASNVSSSDVESIPQESQLTQKALLDIPLSMQLRLVYQW